MCCLFRWEILIMEETNNSNIASLRKNYGGFKQIAFWDKFASVIFCFNVIVITCGVILGIFVCLITNEDVGSIWIFLTVLIGIIIGAILVFSQYVLLMFLQLFLSYLYDIKQQRIALENLALLESGKALDNRTIETFATITQMDSMSIDSSDVVK